MVDIHHHLLWGLDDGSKDIETSIAMVKASAEDGVTHIVCTPHANGTYDFVPEVNAEPRWWSFASVWMTEGVDDEHRAGLRLPPLL